MNLQRLRMLFHKIHFTLIVDGCKRAEYCEKKIYWLIWEKIVCFKVEISQWIPSW